MDRIDLLKDFIKGSPSDSFLQHALALEYIKIGNDESAKVLFEEILNRAQIERETDPSITGTAKFLISASYFEENKDVIKEAREKLLKEDPRKLILNCLRSIVKKIQTTESSKRYMWVDRLENLAIRGLGLTVDELEFIGSDSKNIFRSEPQWDKIESHINQIVLGDSFIMNFSIPEDKKIWGGEIPLRISSCDASQHRFKLTLPYFNKTFSTPIVVNNAAGIIKERNGTDPNWIRVAVPKSTQDFENWVIVGTDEFRDLEENDYEWATKSAMDVGQFYVEESYIFTYGGASKRPDVHFRDGTIFTQDRAMNCKLQNRHGELTREAIFRMVKTIQRAKDLGIIFCGVSKIVQLKLYSIIIDYYIKEVMGDQKWNITESMLSDSEIMRFFLCNEKFDGSAFNEVYVTCPIVRSFYVKSNLNSRTDKQAENDLKSLESVNHTRTMTARQIVEDAIKIKVAMFFVGHSRTDEFYMPRYEFVYYDEYKNEIVQKITQILSAIRLATVELDQDHQRTLEEPILVPQPLMFAHEVSKAMGEELVQDWCTRTWAEYIKMKDSVIPKKSN